MEVPTSRMRIPRTDQAQISSSIEILNVHLIEFKVMAGKGTCSRRAESESGPQAAFQKAKDQDQ